jgi:hypothetical protein
MAEYQSGNYLVWVFCGVKRRKTPTSAKISGRFKDKTRLEKGET